MKDALHTSGSLTEDEVAFFSDRENWSYGPTFDVVLSYESVDQAVFMADRLAEAIDIACPWPDPWKDVAVRHDPRLPRGHVIVRDRGLGVSFGAMYYVSPARRNAIGGMFPPRFTLGIPPRQLKRACGVGEFWQSTEPTERSLALLNCLMNFAHKAHALQPVLYGHVLDETWGFTGSEQHNPCVATYPKFAAATGMRLKGVDPQFALLDVNEPLH